jgi:DNA polymerase delta subunit 1
MLREEFDKHISFFNLDFPKGTYESKINFPLRYMIDNEIVGMSWVELPRNKYTLIKHKISNCQIEATIKYINYKSDMMI